MCGIVGFSGNFSLDSLKASISSLSHRGPDHSGYILVNDDKIGLGHTRLSILDLSIEGNQPMISENGNVIIYNGEIYNYKILKEELLKDGFIFKSQTDTEVLLLLYEKYGTSLLSFLNGIFAFAIYDSKLNKIFIARDNFGVKPLYLYQNENGIIFASEIKAITSFINLSEDKIYKKSVRNHISYLFNPNNNVMVDCLKKISPGEYLIIENGNILEKTTWFNLAKDEISYTKPQENIEKVFTKKLREAVHRQMVSDVPVGALLSGGLDSSAIVAFASEYDKRLPCFTIINQFDEKDGFVDDLPYAKKVAKIFNLPLFEVEVQSSDLIENLYKTISILEEPLADPAALNLHFICQIAKSNDIKVLLSGTGGDDILTGYRRHTAINLSRYLNYLPSFAINFLNKLIGNSHFSGSKIRRLVKFLDNLKYKNEEQIINYFKWTSDNMINSLIEDSEQFKQNNDNEMKNFLSLSNEKLPLLEKMLLLEKRFFLADHNLLYNDKMSMASSIELRVPFLDIEFERFCNKIPLNQKQKLLNNKWILKKAMENHLPKEIIYRSKTGFGAPIRSWVKNELKEFINDSLSESNIKKRNLFNYNYIRNLILDNLENRVDASYTIFSLLCIEIWFQIFIDKKFTFYKSQNKVA